MSGFVGVISADDAPIDRRLLQQLTAFLIYRGPDAQAQWIDGSVGFGHALLRTSSETECRRQPLSLDGAVWITGDVRVDGRADLMKKLESERSHRLQTASDAELILHAYHAWGEDCVTHLLGDFAYAIWDGRKKRLFCARDHFGVRPFYYAETGGGFVFSNTLNCVRLHPAVSGKLNDSAIGDYLLCGYNQEPTTTTFADIKRLAPAHVLTWSAGSTHVRRYWTLPADGQIQYRRPADYVDHFRELWRTAVEDRLRGDRVSVLMSGGLDSTSIAVTAHDLLSARSEADLSAYTLVYDRLIPDKERHYAGLVAEALRIPIHYLAADDYTLFGRCDEPGYQTPEPTDNPLPALTADQFRLIARDNRVALSGDGGDPALCSSPVSHFVDLLRAGRPATMITELVRCLAHGQRPPLGIRTALKRLRGSGPWRPPYPPWVSQEFAARVHLRSRWEELIRGPALRDSHRPRAYRELQSPFWPYVFETYDPGFTLCPLACRHPFFDVRLLTYLLAVPPMPWFLEKKLLRDAMRGWTPEPVRRRPKTPLIADPVRALLRQPRAQWINNFDGTPELVQYVDVKKIPKIAGVPQQVDLYGSDWPLVTRPLCLNYWLAHGTSSRLTH
jgi:asparagine synthase (glutamine-hydrolysing)